MASTVLMNWSRWSDTPFHSAWRTSISLMVMMCAARRLWIGRCTARVLSARTDSAAIFRVRSASRRSSVLVTGLLLSMSSVGGRRLSPAPCRKQHTPLPKKRGNKQRDTRGTTTHVGVGRIGPGYATPPEAGSLAPKCQTADSGWGRQNLMSASTSGFALTAGRAGLAAGSAFSSVMGFR